jgi:hypothetical protein
MCWTLRFVLLLKLAEDVRFETDGRQAVYRGEVPGAIWLAHKLHPPNACSATASSPTCSV